MKHSNVLIPGVCATASWLFSLPVFGQAIDRKLDFSDLVLAGDNTYLIVSDYKMPIHPGYRVSLLTLQKDRTSHVPIPVADWKDIEKAPSDLEACCPVPGKKGEYLLAESGKYLGKFGRIFHVTLTESDELKPHLVVNGVMRMYDRELDEKGRAYSGDQVEGMDCFLAGNRLILVYGERGGATHGGTKTGTIVWGELDLDNYRFKKLDESPICRKSILEGRDCGSLQLIGNSEGGYTVFAVATNDPGEDGPFESIIYQAGEFAITRSGEVEFKLAEKPRILTRLSGLKVEGLARPPTLAPRSTFTISTDDESFGAIVRPVKIK